MNWQTKYPFFTAIFTLFLFSTVNAQCVLTLDTIPSFRKGLYYEKRVKTDSALFYFEQALKDYNRIDDTTGYLLSLLKASNCYLFMFNLKEVKERVDSFKSNLDLLNDGVLLSLVHYSFGKYYRYSNNLDSAYYYNNKSIELRKKHNCSDIILARNHYLLGDIENKRGNHKEAIRLINLSIDAILTEDRVDSLFLAECYSDLAKYTFSAAIDIGGCIENGLKALEIMQEQLGSEDPALSYFYQNLGLYYKVKGDMDKAEGLYDKAKELYLQSKNLKHPNLAALYNSIGNINFDKKDFEVAKMNFESCARIYDDVYGPMSSHHAVPFTNLAETATYFREFDVAEKYLADALNITKMSKATTLEANVYSSYGFLALKKETYVDACKKFNKGLELLKQDGETRTIDAAQNFIGLGMALIELDEQTKARKHLFKALRILDDNGVEKGKEKIEINKYLGMSYYRSKDFKNGLKYINNAINFSLSENTEIEGDQLPNTKEGTIYYSLFDMLLTKGEYYLALYKHLQRVKDLKLALEHFSLAQKMVVKIRTKYRSEESKFNLAERAHEGYKLAVPTAYELYEITCDERYLHEAFKFSESDKAGVLMEALVDVDAKQFAGVPDSLVNKEREIKISLSYFRETLHYELEKNKNSQNQEKIRILEDSIYHYSNEFDEMVVTMEKEFPKYYQLKLEEPLVPIQKIQNSLAEGQCMLEYFMADEELYVFVIGKTDFHLKQIPYIIDIPKSIKEVRANIMKRINADFLINSHDLYNQLVEPVLGDIEGRKLMIVPDREINLLPFGLLVESINNELLTTENFYNVEFLIERFPICYNYSGALYSKSKEHREKKVGYSILGVAPDFGEENLDYLRSGNPSRTTDYSKLRPLPWAKKEVENIGDRFTGTNLIGEEATEVNFKEQAGDYSVLHCATHAISTDNHSLYSGLVFQADSTIEDDGFLHTHELYNLDLNADLAVLSACNTGLGKVQRGEGTMSMARGFSYSGCPNILVGKWSLADKATSRLMGFFYQYLGEGLPKDEALQKAKIAYVNTVHHNLIKPIYWGGMTIIGNEEAIDLKKSYNKWLLSCSLLLACLGGGIIAWKKIIKRDI